ncbi:MAG: AP2 domain-containing protein [Candidatus Curtissbacteria bacterium]|nr:AP2 domain-containing protein [Candidatus Curtissbacteria bacterium]
MKKIELSGKIGKGKFVIVDNEDFDYLNQFRWHYDNGYAHRREYFKNKDNKFDKTKYKNIYMHNLIIDCPEDKTTDHKNFNGLDNRKENLRIGSWTQNMQNTRSSKNGFKGVFFANDHKRIKRWRAEINVNKKRICLGYFKTSEQAGEAYNYAAKQYFGEFAYLNQIGVNT